jgi:hypothetical protein
MKNPIVLNQSEIPKYYKSWSKEFNIYNFLISTECSSGIFSPVDNLPFCREQFLGRLLLDFYFLEKCYNSKDFKIDKQLGMRVVLSLLNEHLICIKELDEELYEKHKSCTNFDYIKNSIVAEKNKKRGYDYEKSYFINRVEDFYFSVNEIPSMKWLTDLEKDLVDISFFLNNSDFISRVFRDTETGKLNNYGRLLLKYSRVPKL